MVNFELVIEMVELICKGDIPKGSKFNEFCSKFYVETKLLPLSKFLKMRGYSNKMPKIMNTRKAGEILFETKGKKDIEELIKNAGYTEIPQLNYSAVMILRKVPLEKNWQKLLTYLKGEGTLDEILRTNKKMLLPEEKSKINEFIQDELGISTTELNWLVDKYQKISKNKKIHNSINKLF